MLYLLQVLYLHDIFCLLEMLYLLVLLCLREVLYLLEALLSCMRHALLA